MAEEGWGTMSGGFFVLLHRFRGKLDRVELKRFDQRDYLHAHYGMREFRIDENGRIEELSWVPFQYSGL